MTTNKHIENYLTYYLNSNFNPGFAVLLQGKWGCGKTWFIKQFIEKYPKSDKQEKFIYITLYGVTSVSEIEDQIFQQLHPILSSKAMALSGKILKGIARASLKIDFDGDNRSDGSLNVCMPNVNLPDYLKNTSKSILIIDDLERCAIPLNALLGYINSFVEHQELKVIIIANEEELQCVESNIESENKLYRKIKEKLIGKTFQVEHDIEQAYIYFISQVEKEQAKEFLINCSEKIIEIFNTANYCNLRHLKQCLWDFERFYQNIPAEYRKKTDLMEELLSHFFAFSFEIKSGQIIPTDIKDLTSVAIREMLSKDNKDNSHQSPIDIVLKKYTFISAYDMILTEQSWRDLFGKGYLAEVDLKESLGKSKYCQDDNTPTWVKLWHYFDLEDDEFASLYSEVLSHWNQKQFVKPGEVLHICGLFLCFSHRGLIDRDIDDILLQCKKYIDNLKNEGKFKKYHGKKRRLEFVDREQWGGLGYAGNDLKEFQDVFNYLVQKMNDANIDNLPDAGKELMETLITDTRKFERMIYLSNTDDAIYYETPIFKYIDPNEFFKVFLNLPNSKKKSAIFAIEERYKFHDFASKLSEEIDFLKEFDSLLTQEAAKKKGFVSGYILNYISSHYLTKTIEKIENAR